MSTVENNLFFEVSEDLLGKLGYETIVTHEDKIKDIGVIEMCVSFTGSKFLHVLSFEVL